MLPIASRDHYAQQQQVMAAVLAAASRLWQVSPPEEFDTWYDRVGPSLVQLIAAGQRRAVADADDYVSAALAERGTVIHPDVSVSTAPLIGVASDGRGLDGLVYGAVIHAKSRVAAGYSPPQAWRAGRNALLLRVQTQVADASRVATGLSIAVRPKVGYVRMLNPPSCSRCVVLAGRYYRKSAFLRHPGCDCRMIPSTEDRAEDLRTAPRGYFESLTTADQDKIFTRAGAEAIRVGADIEQVVNARRDLYTASTYGRDVAATHEGVTRRGRAYDAMAQTPRFRTADQFRAGRYPRLRTPRLMPEAIEEIADDRDDYLRLLKLYGYIT